MVYFLFGSTRLVLPLKSPGPTLSYRKESCGLEFVTHEPARAPSSAADHGFTCGASAKKRIIGTKSLNKRSDRESGVPSEDTMVA